jgi:hypothetical protein
MEAEVKVESAWAMAPAMARAQGVVLARATVQAPGLATVTVPVELGRDLPGAA